MNCDRCCQQTLSTIMSMFNTDLLCPACKEKERKHPDYERARMIEGAHVLAGYTNFAGVGKPPDL